MRSKKPKRMSKMKAQSSHLIALFFFFLLFCGLARKAGAAAASVADKCNKDFNKVVSCLDYAKGSASTPTKDCCNSVKEIKDDDPVCLCYVIQLSQNGSDQIKNLGIKQERLLQLPTACDLKNASVTNCPGLLGLSPTSPAAAIFTNASAGTPSTPSTGTSSSPEAANIGSGLGPNSAVLMATAITMIFFLFAFPVGSSSAATSFELGST
ncbi:hypothetical protein FH972_011751 [Carpinus fangiana]|uniref:Bifunctional inhibitor/plant lipid transfer protein/seed storage helical domain-containing protein n=1 Tax=Carpinus fangiana TaxID=176857 RepID=A0A660KSB6_9ROSI|nr:hypothetical protein FH972_011751 [Carpinus fangiana]